MIEGILAWVCLIAGIIIEDTNYFIASGVFAIAAQICLQRKGGTYER